MPPAETRPGSSRVDPAWLLLLGAALLLARAGWGVWESYHPAAKSEHVRWVPFGEAEAVARTTGKPVLYDFSADWCEPCNRMKADVFSNPDFAHAIESEVVPVRVLDRTREEGRNAAWVDSLQRAFAVTGFPTLVVYSPANRRSRMTSGYGGMQATMTWVHQNAVAVRMGIAPDGTPIP